MIGEGEGKGDREREEEGEKEGEGERETEGKREGEDEAERVENRRVYLMSLSQPLIKAVHDLETLSSVVQFSASPAIISEAGIAMQQDLLKVHFTMYIEMHMNECNNSCTIIHAVLLNSYIIYQY